MAAATGKGSQTSDRARTGAQTSEPRPTERHPDRAAAGNGRRGVRGTPRFEAVQSVTRWSVVEPLISLHLDDRLTVEISCVALVRCSTHTGNERASFRPARIATCRVAAEFVVRLQARSRGRPHHVEVTPPQSLPPTRSPAAQPRRPASPAAVATRQEARPPRGTVRSKSRTSSAAAPPRHRAEPVPPRAPAKLRELATPRVTSSTTPAQEVAGAARRRGDHLRPRDQPGAVRGERAAKLRSIASITKVMTALVFLESDCPTSRQPVTVERADVYPRVDDLPARRLYGHRRRPAAPPAHRLGQRRRAGARPRISPYGTAGFHRADERKGRRARPREDPLRRHRRACCSANVSSAYDMARLIALRRRRRAHRHASCARRGYTVCRPDAARSTSTAPTAWCATGRTRGAGRQDRLHQQLRLLPGHARAAAADRPPGGGSGAGRQDRTPGGSPRPSTSTTGSAST